MAILTGSIVEVTLGGVTELTFILCLIKEHVATGTFNTTNAFNVEFVDSRAGNTCIDVVTSIEVHVLSTASFAGLALFIIIVGKIIAWIAFVELKGEVFVVVGAFEAGIGDGVIPFISSGAENAVISGGSLIVLVTISTVSALVDLSVENHVGLVAISAFVERFIEDLVVVITVHTVIDIRIENGVFHFTADTLIAFFIKILVGILTSNTFSSVRIIVLVGKLTFNALVVISVKVHIFGSTGHTIVFLKAIDLVAYRALFALVGIL
mmetsp:Transcript_23831/g.20773  ORF Transcript_23831/g.20773 Transcript_23831/m.20773 type:complete len:266 (-) Transcript_23831:191-988(-)